MNGDRERNAARERGRGGPETGGRRLAVPATLAGTVGLSLALAYAGAGWIAPGLSEGRALIVWSGVLAAGGAALPWLVLWLSLSRRGQRPPSADGRLPEAGPLSG